MRVIYANDLLKNVEGLRGTTNHNVMWRDGYYTAICDVKCIIENMPHVVRKPAPPKKGEWLEVSMEVGEFNGDVNGKCELTIVSGKCSECKCYSYSLMQYTPQMPPFCSKCGAVMK